MPGVGEAVRTMRNDQRDPGAGAGVPAPVFSHDDDASVAGSPRPVVPPEWAEKLRDIQSITDAALSMLDPRALLDALVDRAKEALGADTSAILLLDRRSGLLVATAASGLEEEVQQGVRIPVGKGFAGRIAAQGRPVILDEVDHTKVINPILLEKGIRSLMGAPLLADGEVIGVLHVGTLRPRAFTDHDVDLLQLAADRAAVAVQALTAQLDRAATAALQRSLAGSYAQALRHLNAVGRLTHPGTAARRSAQEQAVR
jgi:phosphoserine phosphatase RsbU/P